MVAKTRLVGLVVAILAVALLAGCGNDKKGDGATPEAKAPKLSGDLKLVPKEKTNSFDKSKLTAKPGTVMITVAVPADAKRQHGVGIDDGKKMNIKGAPVKPGRSTSLTVDLKPGTYEIFDSYKDNRKRGFTADLTVKK